MLAQFDLEVERIRQQCTQMEDLKDVLKMKVDGVDKLELENLELHLQIDAKLRALETLLKCGPDASKIFKFENKRVKEMYCQTDVVFEDLVHKEATLGVFESELNLRRIKLAEDVALKENEMLKRERDLEIRERLIEEKRIEYSYKQKELNQRIKS